MDSIIAIKTNTYTLLATTPFVTTNIFPFKKQKFYSLNKTILTGLGDLSHLDLISNLAIENAKYQELKYKANTDNIIIKTIQNKIYNSLRTRTPMRACFMVGSLDSLCIIDQYGASIDGLYMCEGYAKYFGYGILDSHYDPDMSIKEGLEVLQMILKTMKVRFAGKVEAFVCKVVSEDGIQDVEITV